MKEERLERRVPDLLGGGHGLSVLERRLRLGVISPGVGVRDGVVRIFLFEPVVAASAVVAASDLGEDWGWGVEVG